MQLFKLDSKLTKALHHLREDCTAFQLQHLVSRLAPGALRLLATQDLTRLWKSDMVMSTSLLRSRYPMASYR